MPPADAFAVLCGRTVRIVPPAGSGCPPPRHAVAGAWGGKRPSVELLYEDALLRIWGTADPYGLALSGEVDASNQAALARCLLGLDGVRGDHTVDLTGVRFLSFPALHLLVSYAHALVPERRLLLLTREPVVGRMLTACGWDELPGLYLTVLEENSDV
jgi:anti-anti-sigma regulatory factor